jgi:MFS transporter, MHS family, proline/betaine transporter
MQRTNSRLCSSRRQHSAAAVVRPIAGVALGIYADRVCRNAALTLTIFTMGLGTGLIVLAPDYASIGIWATMLMVSARLLQGFACGGELRGATAILIENAPDRGRGLYASWQTASQATGMLLGSLVAMLVSPSMTRAELEARRWRLPFAFGLLIVPVGFYVRSKLKEPDAYLKARTEGCGRFFHVDALARAWRAFHWSWRLRLPCARLRAVRVYAHVRGSSAPAAVFPSSDRDRVVKRHPVRMLFCHCRDLGSMRPQTAAHRWSIGFAALTYPAIVLITTEPSLYKYKLAAVQSGFALGMAAYAGPVISVCAELFPTHLRPTAVSLVHNIAVVLVGGFAPLIVTWLIAARATPIAPAFLCGRGRRGEWSCLARPARPAFVSRCEHDCGRLARMCAICKSVGRMAQWDSA